MRRSMLYALLFVLSSCGSNRSAEPVTEQAAAQPVSDEQAIIARERRALDEWSSGNPAGYIDGKNAEAGVTYFDDIGAQNRVDGIDAMQSYLASLKGKIPPHRYEIVNPKVQLYGDVGIMTLHYQGYGPEGQKLTLWKATSVYHRSGGEWRAVHAHWSMVKTTSQGG